MKNYVQRKEIDNVAVLLAYDVSRKFRDLNQWIYPYDILMQVFGCCFKVAYRAMERASDKDLIDCGITLRSGWITEKGYCLLDSAGFALRKEK